MSSHEDWLEINVAGNANCKVERVSTGSFGPLRRFISVAIAVWAKLSDHNISILSAAVAFYSFLSIFPAIAALVSLYGLVADTNDIVRQLNALHGILPGEATALVSERLKVLEQGTHPPFGVGLMVSVGISMWSARYATGTLMTALNVTYAVSEERGLVLFNAVALSLTVALIVLAGGAVILIAVIPLLLSYLPIPTGWQAAAILIRWPLLVCMIIAIVALLYRYAPNRSEPRWDLASAGGLLATTGLIAGSYAFSTYVNTFAAYQKTYGSLGAVAVLMTWLWVAAYSILAGAELNAEIGRRLSQR
ncbi:MULTISPECIES: YihY/virulence factor BrkB family protein [unclassified Bradyrhizobium]|uniref:YihY/virulence factor BrkB family protein n=1 Tax=unclassified Bradyrhizobium TaxID=2631580 RepID=UPI001FFA1B65|nr:YihY/virulence factor BrkB family protein [Bradyrhizobium sp. 45]MCK1435398.1 YihY/virulence factor BrkB family protein [Bradyrhizobium sp. 15]MCK1451991.1 YihY/virulence factor BrkB family protein [Bradyrhizobium sp. 35]MCK1614899.1 YihY/virulence factor BrkB family protein [Bradyrhizobium sp. 163]MCK1760209.1 YihY/virulence factor BrkB family protein [Bradyrhizobium sp. 136]